MPASPITDPTAARPSSPPAPERARISARDHPVAGLEDEREQDRPGANVPGALYIPGARA